MQKYYSRILLLVGFSLLLMSYNNCERNPQIGTGDINGDDYALEEDQCLDGSGKSTDCESGSTQLNSVDLKVTSANPVVLQDNAFELTTFFTVSGVCDIGSFDDHKIVIVYTDKATGSASSYEYKQPCLVNGTWSISHCMYLSPKPDGSCNVDISKDPILYHGKEYTLDIVLQVFDGARYVSSNYAKQSVRVYTNY